MAIVIPFNRERNIRAGALEEVAPGIRRLLAPNPGPFTFAGTNTYVVGKGRVAVIDPGPDIGAHIDALTRALARETVTHIFVTHTHNDHSPAARPLKAETGAVVCAYSPHGVARADDGVAVEEAADLEFVPDLFLGDGERITGDGWTIEAVHTPGHTSNHLCYALREEQALFTGDHVMSWSTSVVVPPDGDMQAYMESLEKLLHRRDRVLWPAHGGPVLDPQPFLRAFIAHREEREAQIVACLEQGIGRIPDMVRRIYADVDPVLHPAAALTVHAHLIRMVAQGRAASDGAAKLASLYRAT
jgi:glyoxylase-like metal-dependent hydrolase (beta-lactamase superfamily II)